MQESKVPGVFAESKRNLAREVREAGAQAGPEIIVLIGSTRFADEYKRLYYELTMRGKIVISVGRYGHQDGLDMKGPHKAALDALHLCKINTGHAVYLINPGRYCGESTARELVYAAMQGKRIYSLEPVPDWFTELQQEGFVP
jgi:hypothetical protein